MSNEELMLIGCFTAVILVLCWVNWRLGLWQLERWKDRYPKVTKGNTKC